MSNPNTKLPLYSMEDLHHFLDYNFRMSTPVQGFSVNNPTHTIVVDDDGNPQPVPASLSYLFTIYILVHKQEQEEEEEKS